MADTVLGTLAAISQASSRANFELQFNNLQNTLTRRYNAQVDKISDSSSTKHQVEALQNQSKGLIESLPILEQYRIGNENNYSQLEVVQNDLADLKALISNDNNVTADEVTAFNTLRDKIADRVSNIFIFVHPDINDANVTQRLKDSVDAFRALSPVVGTLDGDNAGLTDGLNTFINNASVTAEVTSNTIQTTLNLELKVQSDFSGVDAKLLSLTYEEKQRRNTEIDSLKTDLGNTLRAISLTFETNSGLATQLNSGLEEQLPAAGSVLNFFI